MSNTTAIAISAVVGGGGSAIVLALAGVANPSLLLQAVAAFVGTVSVFAALRAIPRVVT